jgi:hypothetical protein
MYDFGFSIPIRCMPRCFTFSTDGGVATSSDRSINSRCEGMTPLILALYIDVACPHDSTIITQCHKRTYPYLCALA